jgi:arginine/ornithine transport system substrate-binding protein
MKRLCGLLALWLVLIPASAVTLRIGINPFTPPMGYLDDNGDPAGFDIDIARALCRRMAVDCELIQTPFSELIPGLRARRFDAVVASLSITEARKQLVDFTDKYYVSPARYVGARGRAIPVTPEGLDGRVIGVMRGTTSAAYLQDNHADTATVVRYGYQDEALLDLLMGRLDLVLGDEIMLQENFLATEAGREFRFIGPALDDPRWFGEGIGIAVRQGNDELRGRINEALRSIRADGTYLQIQDRYFDYDIYGADTDTAPAL